MSKKIVTRRLSSPGGRFETTLRSFSGAEARLRRSDVVVARRTASVRPAPSPAEAPHAPTDRPCRPRRAARSGSLLVHHDDDEAVEPAALGPFDRVGAGEPRSMAREHRRALLVLVDGARSGRADPEGSAGRRRLGSEPQEATRPDEA